MAREKFEKRLLEGPINVACKFEDGTVRYWNTDKETVVSRIIHIIDEYQKEGYVLTLRQLHYQFVTQNWIVNHDTAYKKLGGILDDCKYAGIIDWDSIEDRGRIPFIPYWVKGVNHAIEDTIEQYRLDRMAGQENYIELWTEKDALSGILRRTTSKYHIRLVVNKGYTSSTALYNAYERFVENILSGRKVTILYFGDHDPSGLDMVRDIEHRLMLFLSQGDKLQDDDRFTDMMGKWWADGDYSDYNVLMSKYCDLRLAKALSKPNAKTERFEEYFSAKRKFFIDSEKLFQVVPIGLTKQQIKKYKLPPNPTKLTDSRAEGYIKDHGSTCWEVDALKPQVLTSIVESNILSRIDDSIFQKIIKQEEKDVKQLKKFIKK